MCKVPTDTQWPIIEVARPYMKCYNTHFPFNTLERGCMLKSITPTFHPNTLERGSMLKSVGRKGSKVVQASNTSVIPASSSCLKRGTYYCHKLHPLTINKTLIFPVARLAPFSQTQWVGGWCILCNLSERTDQLSSSKVSLSARPRAKDIPMVENVGIPRSLCTETTTI